MAAAATSSPVPTNNGSQTPTAVTSTPPPPSTAAPATGVKSPAFPTINIQRSDTSKTLRGLNKPKCGQCGNVARSRCPFQCCKSCCFKAQNPCHIHVLKPNATLADRGASANATVPEQQPSEVASSTFVESRPSVKVNPLRQLSSTFSQFNNVHLPLRSRKPLSKKDALIINEWRFAKLKEYKESNIEAENEAFDRYMQNINLLEEVLDVNSERPDEAGSQVLNVPTNSGEKKEMISEMKVKLRSNPMRIDTFRKRIRHTVDQGLRMLQTYKSNDGSCNVDEEGDLTPKAAKNWWGGKTSALGELNEKLNRARSEEDLKLCTQMRSRLKGQHKAISQKKTDRAETSKEHTAPNHLDASLESGNPMVKLVRITEIDQDDLNSIDSFFSSLEEIEDL